MENIPISKKISAKSKRFVFVVVSSNAWEEISNEEKQELGVNVLNDGEFWMSFDDFFANFHQLHICHRGPASLGTTEGDAGACTWNNLFRV